MTEQREWAEPLPEECPPQEARDPEDEVFYRLVDEPTRPKQSDFFSPRKLKPQRNFKDASLCETLGLSVFSTIDACRKVGKLAGLRDKQVAEVTLPPECGVVLQTRGPKHYSWWLKAAFNPVSICKPINKGEE